jgi:hypothetical protein
VVADLQETIAENATAPKSAEVDGVKAQQHDLTEQIAADRYLKSCRASSRRHRGLRFTKFVPPGASS